MASEANATMPMDQTIRLATSRAPFSIAARPRLSFFHESRSRSRRDQSFPWTRDRAATEARFDHATYKIQDTIFQAFFKIL